MANIEEWVKEVNDTMKVILKIIDNLVLRVIVLENKLEDKEND